eukprot:gene8451-6110_t
MSAVPNIGTYTSQDIDLRLKESEKLLNEWAKLLEKAEKTSNPSDIPKGDVEQHIRLKRKLNESLGTLARIAQAHVNRTKSSRTDGKTGPNTVASKAADSSKAAVQSSSHMQQAQSLSNQQRPMPGGNAPYPTAVGGTYPSTHPGMGSAPMNGQPMNAQHMMYAHPNSTQGAPMHQRMPGNHMAPAGYPGNPGGAMAVNNMPANAMPNGMAPNAQNYYMMQHQQSMMSTPGYAGAVPGMMQQMPHGTMNPQAMQRGGQQPMPMQMQQQSKPMTAQSSVAAPVGMPYGAQHGYPGQHQQQPQQVASSSSQQYYYMMQHQQSMMANPGGYAGPQQGPSGQLQAQSMQSGMKMQPTTGQPLYGMPPQTSYVMSSGLPQQSQSQPQRTYMPPSQGYPNGPQMGQQQQHMVPGTQQQMMPGSQQQMIPQQQQMVPGSQQQMVQPGSQQQMVQPGLQQQMGPGSQQQMVPQQQQMGPGSQQQMVPAPQQVQAMSTMATGSAAPGMTNPPMGLNPVPVGTQPPALPQPQPQQQLQQQSQPSTVGPPTVQGP